MGLDEHSRDYIERMGKSARRMKRFIEDLLLYSKVTTKQKPFELVDLEKKVKTVCEEMDHIIHSTHAVVNISNLPTIEGDNNQIHQLIVNLIFNSFKYKSEGKPPIINIFGKKKENNYWEILDVNKEILEKSKKKCKMGIPRGIEKLIDFWAF